MEKIDKLSGEISFTRPAPVERFNARIVYTEHIKNAIWFCGIFFFIGGCLLFSQNKMPAGLIMVLFGGIGAIVSYQYNRVKNYPVVMEAFDNGVWFNWENVFFPYERLASCRIVRTTQRAYHAGTYTMRSAVFTFQTTREEKKQIKAKQPFFLKLNSTASGPNEIKLNLYGQDGVVEPSFGEIVDQIKTLAVTHKKALGLPEPIFSIDP